MASKILNEAKEIGVTGGTIFLGKGTVKNHILEMLGLDESKKEILVLVAESHLEDKIHETLTEKFHMNKPNHGIIFSLPVNRIVGVHNHSTPAAEPKIGGKNHMGYEVIFTVVDKGLGQAVVDAANAAGARGATIINARGSGIHEKSKFFAMNIEPEKDMVMIIIKKEISNDVVESIKKALKIEEPGRGIIFVLDVNRTSGLHQDDGELK